MRSFLTCYTVLVALTNKQEVNGYVSKEIPEHLLKEYGLIDPTKDIRHPNNPSYHEVLHAIKNAPKRDPTRKKTHEDIPRVPDHEIHEEEIPHDQRDSHP